LHFVEKYFRKESLGLPQIPQPDSNDGGHRLVRDGGDFPSHLLQDLACGFASGHCFGII